MTMVSRKPKMLVGVDVAHDKSPKRIQKMVDNSFATAENYYTDGYLGYIDVVYPGKHIRNIHDKSNTFTVEGVNSDLRHYIPILRRNSKCFARSLETFKAVLEVFQYAYNQFGIAKAQFCEKYGTKEPPFSLLNYI